MTFQYDEFADSLHVSLSEPSSACIYVESESFGVLLRVEEITGLIRGFEVSAWRKRIGIGQVLIPEIGNSDFVREWLLQQSLVEIPKARS